MTTRYGEALVDFADVKKGDVFRILTMTGKPEDFHETYRHYLNKPVYPSQDFDESKDVFLTEDMYKPAVFKLQDFFKEKIVYAEKGTQSDEGLCESFDLSKYDLNWSLWGVALQRFESKFVERHYCTDQYVGTGSLWLDGEVVAIFSQRGRKWPCQYKFLSKELALKVKAVLESCMNQQDEFDLVTEDQNIINFVLG